MIFLLFWADFDFFSSVIDGFETLDAIERARTGPKNRPTNEIVIKSVTIHANPIAELEA
jgi:peptidyl-prolyl cis-trans isomerase-like 3